MWLNILWQKYEVEVYCGFNALEYWIVKRSDWKRFVK